MTTLTSVCNSCSKCTSFGFRPRSTFNIDDPKGCNCIISEKGVISDFLALMHYHNLLLDVKYEENSHENKTLNRTQLKNKVSDLQYDNIIKRMESKKKLEEVSDYVFDVASKVFKIPPYVSSICPWEYLDIGCGTGRISRNISASLEAMVQHVDVKDNRIEKYSHEDFEDFMIFDGVNLPHEKNMYTVITCLTVLHHVDNTEGLIKSIYETLKPGGIFIMKEFDCRNWKEAYSLDFMNFLLSESSGEDGCVTSYNSKKGWRVIIEGCGFELLDEYYKDCSVYDPYYTYFDVFQKPVESKTEEKNIEKIN